jgi:hypothetical protein
MDRHLHPVVEGSPTLSNSRRSVKARPIGLSPWKQIFLRRCEERVKEKRTELLDSLRHRASTAAELMTDLVADEHARCRDENSGTASDAASGGRRSGTSEDDADDGDRDLTEDERLELLLYLQAKLYCDAADDDEAQEWLASVHEWERAEVEALVDWSGEGDAGAPEATLTAANPFLTPAVSRRSRSPYCGPPSCVTGRLAGGAASAPVSRFPRELSAGAPATLSGVAAAAACMLDEEDINVSSPAATAAIACNAGTSSAQCASPNLERLQQSDVLCPVCRRKCLFSFETAIGCRCGFRMNTAGGMTIDHLQRSLAETYATHRSGCSAEPVFQLRDYFGVDALWMVCQACDDLQVVL